MHSLVLLAAGLALCYGEGTNLTWLVPAHVAIRTSKSQSKYGFSRLQVAIEVIIAESKGQFPSACREPEQENGRGGCGNASGSGEQDAVHQPVLSELIAEPARSAAYSRGSAGSAGCGPLWPLANETKFLNKKQRSLFKRSKNM